MINLYESRPEAGGNLCFAHGIGFLGKTITYSQSVVLTLKVGDGFEKGMFLRDLKRELGDYILRNYSEVTGRAIITLASRGDCLTEHGTDRDVAEIDGLRIKKIVEEKGLELENMVFDATPKIQGDFI